MYPEEIERVEEVARKRETTGSIIIRGLVAKLK